MSLADWCGLSVAVDVPPGGDVLQPHQVPVLDQVHDGVWVRPGQEVLDGVEEGLGEVPEDAPQLPAGEDTDDEEADKLVKRQITSSFHLDLLADVSDGPHVGVLHVVLDHHTWFAVGEGTRTRLERRLRHYGHPCH